MKVLITGASGFIGQYVLKRLESCGIDTVAIGRTLPKNCSPKNFKQVDLIDHSNFDDLLSDIGATHLLHLAWYTEHGDYWESTLNLDWMQASVNLVKAFCKAGGQNVVMAGTCAEYDWSFGYCIEDKTPLRPSTLYGFAKDMTRRQALAVCTDYRVNLAWGRIFFVFGPGEDNRRLLPSLSEVFKGKRGPFGINNEAYRDFLHVEDVAAGFLTLLDVNAFGNYNICSGEPVQLKELAKIIAWKNGKEAKEVLELSTVRIGDPEFLVGNNRKIKEKGWNSQPLVEAIKKNEW